MFTETIAHSQYQISHHCDTGLPTLILTRNKKPPQDTTRITNHWSSTHSLRTACAESSTFRNRMSCQIRPGALYRGSFPMQCGSPGNLAPNPKPQSSSCPILLFRYILLPRRRWLLGAAARRDTCEINKYVIIDKISSTSTTHSMVRCWSNTTTIPEFDGVVKSCCADHLMQMERVCVNSIPGGKLSPLFFFLA